MMILLWVMGAIYVIGYMYLVWLSLSLTGIRGWNCFFWCLTWPVYALMILGALIFLNNHEE